MAKAVQKGLFPKKEYSTKTSVHMRGEQTQAKYHLERSQPVEEKPNKNLSSAQFNSQLQHPWYSNSVGMPKSTQLPMFMSAKEIGKHYQVLDGDRDQNYTYDKDPVYGTDHGEESDKAVVRRKYYEANQYHAAGISGDPDFRATAASQIPKASSNEFGGGLNSEGWDESFDAYGSHGPTLADSIRESGVHKPIYLEAPKAMNEYDGSKGKPQIYGGHHRYAVMRMDRPNDLMPVTFRNDFWEARGEKGYR
jgi:hypothetical protein